MGNPTERTDTGEIEVKNASLQTATISIRTLQVNNKQMTLAVFRQLEELDIFTSRFVQEGPIWGWVNYHPNCQDTDHFHYIWQDGETLRRGTVKKFWVDAVTQFARYEIETIRTCSDGLISDWLDEEEDGAVEAEIRVHDGPAIHFAGCCGVDILWPGMPSVTGAVQRASFDPDFLRDLAKPLPSGWPHDWLKLSRGQVLGPIARKHLRTTAGMIETIQLCDDRLKVITAAALKLQQDIEAAGQLFIAV